MITTFSDFSQSINELLNHEQESIIDEYLQSFKPKICCLESYWSNGMTDPLSVKPFLKSIGWMLEKEIVVAHRMIDSGKGLAYYTKYPTGLIWLDPDLAGIDCFYIAAHGKPGGLRTSVTEIESEELIASFNGLDRYDNIVFFAGCEVLGGEEGKSFAHEFLQKTGTIAVIGYTDLVSWIDGLVIETLFLSRWFEYDTHRFKKIQTVFDSVIKDYPRAKECGFALFLK